MVAVYFFDRVDELYGNNPEDYVVPPPNSEDIAVPSNTFILTDDQVEELKTRIVPHAESDNYGSDLYQQTLEFVDECMRQ